MLKLNGFQIASGDEKGSIKIWDLITEECLTILNGHTSIVDGIVKLNKSQIVCCSWDKSLKI